MRPMHARTLYRLRRRGLAWLLWSSLLLLPLAQSLAAWHELSHVRAGAASQDDRGLPHKTCELCLLAAALDHGGAAAANASLTLSEAAPSVEPSLPPAEHRSATVSPYLSRAPPASV